MSDPILAAYETSGPGRRVVALQASTIAPRRVRWLWDQRLALGSLALLAGPEGLGKSLVSYWLTGRITRGELLGEHYGTPKAVLVCATEDSWAHTIAPRLMAHGADLNYAYRVEAVVDDMRMAPLSLPADLVEVERLAGELDAALLVLDPLMSRLDAKLDSHRDGEVRQALEPLVAMCEQSGMAAWGIIHHNKSGSTDPLQLVMASKAFTAVARSVHTVIRDPDDESGHRRLFGTTKNNLGRSDLALMSFHVQSWQYPTCDGPGETGQIMWGKEVDESIADVLRRGAISTDPEEKTALTECVDWLNGYMAAEGPRVLVSDVKKHAAGAGHTARTLQRARLKLGLTVEDEHTFPRRSWWTLPTGDGMSTDIEVF